MIFLTMKWKPFLENKLVFLLKKKKGATWARWRAGLCLSVFHCIGCKVLGRRHRDFSVWGCFHWFHTALWAMESCADNRFLALKENVVQSFYRALNSVLFDCRVVVP